MGASDIFPVTPIYPIQRDYLPGIVYDEADSGRGVSRLKRAPRRIHHLQFEITPDQKQQIEQWYDQFANSFFTLYDPVFGRKTDGSGAAIERYFSVRFSQQPTYTLKQNLVWDVQCDLTDVLGVALYEYPDPDAGHLSTFIEETDGFAQAGVWGTDLGAVNHGGSDVSNAGNNTTDTFTWIYGGYGLRIWARKEPNFGKMKLFVDGTNLATIDLYAAAETAASAVFSKLDLPLGLHTVQLVATNTKNGASSDTIIVADALEYMS